MKACQLTRTKLPQKKNMSTIRQYYKNVKVIAAFYLQQQGIKKKLFSLNHLFNKL
jgi:hypothetical protein